MTQSTEKGRSISSSEAGYTPFVRAGSRPRPQAAIWEDGVTMFLVCFSMFALFMDGWRHNNMTGIDTFWSAAHILMYSGLLSLGIWIAIVLARHQESLIRLDWSAIPHGYKLAFLALPLSMIAGPADFQWHAAFGFENQIDASYSPPHQGLFLAGALLAAIPAASAWQRRSTAPSLREFLPAVFSLSSTPLMLLFVIHQVVPFYSPHAMSRDFQQDLVGRVDAFAGGHVGEAVHAEGLSRAVAHFGDQAFPYYFYSTHLTMSGILLFSIIVFGAVLLMRRRWLPPAGSLTLMFLWLAGLFPLLSQYREWKLAVPLFLAGIVGDMLLRGLTGGPGPLRIGRIRLFSALMPIALWSMYFVCVQLFKGGLGWGPTLWIGVLTTTAGFCYALSLIVFPPLVDEGERAPAS